MGMSVRHEVLVTDLAGVQGGYTPEQATLISRWNRGPPAHPVHLLILIHARPRCLIEKYLVQV